MCFCVWFFLKTTSTVVPKMAMYVYVSFHLSWESVFLVLTSYAWRGLLIEPATWLMLVAALCTIWYGSYRSGEFYEQFREVLQLGEWMCASARVFARCMCMCAYARVSACAAVCVRVRKCAWCMCMCACVFISVKVRVYARCRGSGHWSSVCIMDFSIIKCMLADFSSSSS